MGKDTYWSQLKEEKEKEVLALIESILKQYPETENDEIRDGRPVGDGEVDQ